MTRSELILALSSKHSNLTTPDVEMSTTMILRAIADRLGRGGRIEIRGFGSFYVTQRPGKIGRNPKTGEAVEIPPKDIPRFKPGKELRERVLSAGNTQERESA